MKCRWLCLVLVLAGGCHQMPYPQGKRLYDVHCANCHMEQGQGLARLYPPLRGTGLDERISDLPCIIRGGIRDTIVVNGIIYDTDMQGISGLTAAEIANIGNYILAAWYESGGQLTESRVEEALEGCTDALR